MVAERVITEGAKSLNGVWGSLSPPGLDYKNSLESAACTATVYIIDLTFCSCADAHKATWEATNVMKINTFTVP